MKKILICLFILIFVISLVSCNSRKNIAQKMLFGGDGEEIEVDDKKMVINGEDGSKMTYGEVEWPTSDLANNIPELKDVKITAVTEMNDGLFIMADGVSKKKFEDYMGKFEEIFSIKPFDTTGKDDSMFIGNNDKGVSVVLTYAEKDKVLSITVTKREEEE